MLWQTPRSKTSATSAPVIVMQAEVIEQGVRVTWLKAQSDSHATHGYTIEKRRSGHDFTQIARVEKDSVEYLDAEGRAGDRYRILTEGDRQRSKPSEPVIASLPKPGSTVVIASLPASQVLSSATPLSPTSTPTDQANSLKAAIEAAFAELERAVAAHKFTEVTSYLHALQNYQRESLLLLAKLSPTQKASLAQACANHAATFETTLHVLPEASQLDGMLVQAGCNTLQEATR